MRWLLLSLALQNLGCRKARTALLIAAVVSFAIGRWSTGAVTRCISVTTAGTYTLTVTGTSGARSPSPAPSTWPGWACGKA